MKRLFLMLFVISISSCLTANKKATRKLVKPMGSYQLIQIISENKVLRESPTKGEIKFDNKNSTVSVYLGCNRIQGRFEALRKQACKTAITSSTRMACPTNFEDTFKNIFNSANHFKIKSDSLFLYLNDVLIMVMAKKTSARTDISEQSPEGNYTLYSVLDGKTMRTESFSKTRFNIDGQQLSANVGCNNMGGSFILNGQTISPMRITMTEMFCEDVDQLERLVAGHLGNVNKYRWANDKLALMHDQQVLMVLVKKDE